VHEKAGVTFASALRAMLRQDPDIMLVGEIRDGETAAIATQAALTGHLVLSTLHTNDAAGALTRLRELGVEPYLVASTVEAVLAQRLVRTWCRDCRGAGCDDCRHAGYRGRVGIHELLVMSDALRAAVQAGTDSATLRRLAEAEGMRTLRAEGERLVAAGITSREEVLRVVA
jgi:general secretion pathway protein E